MWTKKSHIIPCKCVQGIIALTSSPGPEYVICTCISINSCTLLYVNAESIIIVELPYSHIKGNYLINYALNACWADIPLLCTVVSRASAHSCVSAHVLHFKGPLIAPSIQTYGILIPGKRPVGPNRELCLSTHTLALVIHVRMTDCSVQEPI